MSPSKPADQDDVSLEPSEAVPATEFLARLNKQRRAVDVTVYDFTIRELLSMMASGELNISPAYQRLFRWTAVEESRLIESIFLELPIPSLFAAINTDFSWEIVDGLQRLSTLAHFVGEADLLTSVQKKSPLILTGIEQLDFFNRLGFADLPPELQTYFLRRTVRVTALSDQSDELARYELFERLNRGAVRLTEQEVRACVYRGPFLELLEELASLPNFVALTKLQANDERNGTREELVLKFFAYLNARDKFRGRVDKFLTSYTITATSTFDVEGGRRLFENVVAIVFDATQGSPFLRDGVAVTPQNQLEAVLVGVGELLREGAPIASPKDGWQNDDELVSASTGGTNTRAMLSRRIARARKLFAA